MSSSTPTEIVVPELLTLKEAAALCNVSERTVWTWANTGIGPAPLKIGKGTVRYSKRAYLEWIDAGCPRIDALTPALSPRQREEGVGGHEARSNDGTNRRLLIWLLVEACRWVFCWITAS